MTLSATPAEAAPARSKRVPLWDNARFIAITLVVVGHAILKLIAESDTAYGVYLFIYAFHVPVFVAVAGYFAKSDAPGPKQLRRIVTDLVLPYLIFETIWSIIHSFLAGALVFDYAVPSWTLWFLIALIVWRVSLPYLALLKHPLLIAVAISVASGYLPSIGGVFALDRTLALLPFFVLGWRLRQLPLTAIWLRASVGTIRLVRAAAVAVFVLLAIVIAVFLPQLRELKVRRLLLFEEAYPTFGYDQWWGGALRLAVIAVAVVLVFAFLVLMPRSATWFSPLGQATMYVYLLHSFVLYPIRESGLLGGPQNDLLLIGMIVLAVLLAVLLATKPVRRVFRPLVEPRARWLFVTPRVGRD